MLVDHSPKGNVHPSDAAALELASRVVPGLADLAAIRLVLSGESAIDLPSLLFVNRHAVDDFLRLSEFDTDNPLDVGRLNELHDEAVHYLIENIRYRLPRAVEEPNEIHDIFLLAGGPSGRTQRAACTVLKVMHIAHHISGRELLFNTPISEAQLFERLNAKVFRVIDRMRASGIGLSEFAAGQKSRTSLMSKLLSKRSNLAAQIYDKLRFRIVVNSKDDLVLALIYLVRHLFPFNYVIPEQSQNALVALDDLIRVMDLAPEAARKVWGNGTVAPVVELTEGISQPNEFSGRSYRSINFVADIPLRIDDLAPQSAPAVTFVQAELQLMDLETARANERGENAHAMYKKRQIDRVRERLEKPYGTEE